MSEKVRDSISDFHDYGIYLPTKTIRMVGEVDEDLFKDAISNLHILDSISGDITIKLSSAGGDIDYGKAIYDAIRGCKNRVRIIGYGLIASCATLIMQAADERILSPNAKMMVHIGTEGYSEDHVYNVRNAFKAYEDDRKWMEDVYFEQIKKRHSRYTRQKLEDLLVFDKYMSPKECLELGLIDSIGEIQ
jgi:ATP-dependent protease ClpP protease subunit